LARQEARAEVRRELEELWRRLEFQRYSGGAADDGQRLLALLDVLETWFNRVAPRGSGRKFWALGLYLGLALAASAADPGASDTPEQRFERARQAYEQADYASAVRGWQGLLDEGYGGVELVYNLGNAWYRQGDAGRAVLNWERALALNPTDRDARANLDFIRPSLADRFEAPVRLPLWDMLDSWLVLLSGGWLAWAGLFFAGAAAGVAGLRYFLPGRRLSPALRVLLVFLLVPALSALALLALQDRRQAHAPAGVILQAKVEVRAAPSSGATAQFDLHTGTRVQLARSSADGWQEIVVPDGRSGWVPANCLEAVPLPLP
jgi:tetratricopeptide (TPR) repeat protein